MEDLEIAVTKEVALGEFSLYQASVEPRVIFKLPNFMKYLDNTPRVLAGKSCVDYHDRPIFNLVLPQC